MQNVNGNIKSAGRNFQRNGRNILRSNRNFLRTCSKITYLLMLRKEDKLPLAFSMGMPLAGSWEEIEKS